MVICYIITPHPLWCTTLGRVSRINTPLKFGIPSFRAYSLISKFVNPLLLERFLASHINFIRPHLDYGDGIYHKQRAVLTNLIEQVQYTADLNDCGYWKGTCHKTSYDKLGCGNHCLKKVVWMHANVSYNFTRDALILLI